MPILAVALLLACATSTFGQGEARAPRRTLQRAAPVWHNDWSRGSVFYEVFVRSFADSNGDGVGDLKGLISRLDYLNDGNPSSTADLGVDALWLMPVFASPSYHGYDTVDYEHINPAYGTDEDFVNLCKEAHKRGIMVIVDFVVNHTGSGHPWFVDSSSGLKAVKRDWYVWSPVDLGWRQPWNIYGGGPTWHQNPKDGQWFYGVFSEGMPDLNIRNPEVRAEIKRLASLWLSRGVDGFRLDAARHLVENGAGLLQVDQPETHAFWREFSAYVRSVKAEATLVGENWTDTSIIATYYGSSAALPGGDELPMNFDFPLAASIVQGVNSGDATVISAKLAEVQSVYPPGANDASFLTNHDQIRLATQVGRDALKLRNAAAILLTVPGTPFLYYGEEIGLQNGSSDSDDRLKRTPMPWDATSPGGGFTSGTPWFPFAPGRETANVATETGDPGSLLSRYRALIRARHSSEALRQGDLRLLGTGASTRVLAFFRTKGDEQVLVVHNVSDSIQSASYITTASASETVFADPGANVSVGSGSCSVSLLPRTTGIWRLR